MKIRILRFFFIILFLLLGACLFYIQIIKGPFYKDQGFRNSIRLLNISAARGLIYDRHNRLLASNALSFGVFIVPQESSDLDRELNRLSKILSVPKSLLERNYKRNYIASFAACELIRDVAKRTAILIEEAKIDMPGVLVKEISVRKYLYKDIFSHVIGYVGEIDQRELELLKSYGYNVKDLIGKDGIERYCDGLLRGKNGGMQIQIDNRGRRVKVLSFKKPKKGRNVFLTLDSRLQRVVWNLMKDRTGAAIFMEPNTGEILSLVSSPSFNPSGSIVDAMRDKNSPLLNRAIMGLYPAGSVFKIIVAIAGLETKKITPDETFLCPGKLKIGKDEFNCWDRDGHAAMNLYSAIVESCNVYFYNLGIIVGADKIYEYAVKFGLGRKTGIELFGELNGFVPSRSRRKLEREAEWYAGDTANFAIGQGDLLVTPLQICRLIASVANGGILVEPHILKKIGDTETAKRNIASASIDVTDQHLDYIRKAMKDVVEDVNGTGARARSNIVSISAKTGTVQIGPGLGTHGWFAGYAPSEKPKICFVVFLESAGSGGELAAEIARMAVEYWYKNRDLCNR